MILALRQAEKHQGAAVVVAHLASGRHMTSRPAFSVSASVQLEVQATLGASDASVKVSTALLDLAVANVKSNMSHLAIKADVATAKKMFRAMKGKAISREIRTRAGRRRCQHTIMPA